MTASRHLIVTDMPVAALGSPPWTTRARLPPRALPASCDVLIVGAGITGLSAAISLARAGRDVTVIDRAFGGGASARSGGIVLGDTLVGPSPDFAGCHDVLRNWIVGAGADCDFFWCGCLELARDASLPCGPINWQAEGGVRLAGEVPGGVLDPMKLQQELAAAARRRGASIVDEVSLIALARDGSRSPAITDRGDIAAQHVVMAVDATARRVQFDPWSERKITVALQTEPLSEQGLANLGLAMHQAFYTRDLPLLWGRVMPDRSLLVGRETIEFPRRDLERLPDKFVAAAARLTSRVRGLHNELRDVDVRRSWGGPIARSAAGVPAIAADPDHPAVIWVGGYGGQGIAQAFRMGQLVADRLSRS
jgi:gamma-glutamylputrescine oxidase